MDEILKNIPKPVLVFLVIVLGVSMIYLFNPPLTLCDTQVEQLKTELQGVFFPKPIKKIINPPRITIYEQDCRRGNSSGACLDYFTELKKLVLTIRRNHRACLVEVFEINEIRQSLETGVDIMARIAWDNQKPKTLEEGLNWLTESDIYLFCIMKNLYIEANGVEVFKNLKNKVLDKMIDNSPGRSRSATREEKEPLSLFAVPCQSY